MPEFQTRPQKHNSAFASMALRLAVAGYIAVLGYKIITNPETTMQPVTAWILGGALILAAVLFCIYIAIRWKADKQTEENTPSEIPGKEQSNDSSQ